MSHFVERLAKRLSSKHSLCRNQILDIWNAADAG
jgi:hypothetical protein